MSNHTFTDPDLIELDRTWPIGQMLEVPERGTIIVAGAYRGRYIHYLNQMFPTAEIIGYEPQRDVFNLVRNRFLNTHRVFIRSVGLATANREVQFGQIGSDGASALECGGATAKVQMVDAVAEFQRQPIDLFLLNAEGSEWALIPYLLDEMMHHRIASIALQQHTKYASKERIARVLAYLAEYYDRVFDDGKPDGWSYWRRK